ncbi:UvrD-helicase domain-containing protein [Leucobacter sp. NPDC015123]|uniref:UvrD-helicase domain-containing protein n=1 Tax=Leucobacter sp. NPDC015123 TaxID=3364129 RepID=UPI0036F456D8
MSVPVFSAARVAEILAIPGEQPLLPTDEQRAVIEHPLAGSTLVIAGAGSGKTETMANRVVWLVANGLAEADSVLGLTFTRKAAGELRERIVGSLGVFVTRLSDLAELGELNEQELERSRELNEQLADGLALPDVSTYNSFAAGVLQEFGASAGLAPGAVVIDEATAWRVARETLLASDDPDLVTSELRTPTLIRHVIAMDRAVADNLTSFDSVDQMVAEFSGVTRLPYNEKEDPDKPSGKVYAKVRDAVKAIAETPLITRLARAYREEKQRRGLIDFSDQLALATQTLDAAPEALGVLRSRYRAVLLDEVQDTSVGQTRLLAQLFGGMPVMAVGDPHQSIYGWRGASAEGLKSFHRDFRGGESAATLTLSVSWRNPKLVLAAANTVAAELRMNAAVDVPELQPRPGADDGEVEVIYPETVHEERELLAAWIARARDTTPGKNGEPPTAAVIFRKRAAMPSFAAALTEAGVPNRIVGLGGLLSTPEITDIVSCLRCLWYADAGGDLIRLLAGPRFRIGVADLAGLRDAAKWFAQRDVGLQPLADEDRAADSVLPDPDREFTLIDALDAISTMKNLDHGALRGVSTSGRERLREAGQMLRDLRRGVGGNTADLIGAVMHALRLDIELEANEARGAAAGALANIEAFTDLAEGFLAIDTRGTLASLLEWVERALEDDDVAEHVAAPLPGTVQLITAHGSKGLQWDIVAVPRIVTDEFPGSARSGTGWLRTGELPDELRGDRGARPHLNWRIATTQKELCERLDDYRAELKERHAEEERRLAYVAITRSAGRLLLSGSFWGGQTRARVPSVYLQELQGQFFPELPAESVHESDPSEIAELTASWPLDPLGHRAPNVFRAANAVLESLSEAGAPAAALEPAVVAPADDTLAQSGVDETVRLLLAERAAADALATSTSAADAPLPERITASTFHEFVEDPVAAERRRLRPIPQRPYRRTRVGNRFHEWVERRATTPGGTALPLLGLDPDEWDPGRTEFDVEAELEPLIDVYEQSRWASRQPIAVELEVALPFAGRTLVCKLDAVYELEPAADGSDAQEPRFEVVDWKSGRAPTTDAERESRFFQLDLYRHAYAQWAGIAPERIDVSLFYVAENVEIRGVEVRSLAELEAAWLAAAAKLAE